jgi:hypothetical protein
MAFKLGLGFLPLAEAALDALDTWTAELPSEVLHPYLREVLPQLDGYLKTASELGNTLESAFQLDLALCLKNFNENMLVRGFRYQQHIITVTESTGEKEAELRSRKYRKSKSKGLGSNKENSEVSQFSCVLASV